jgi:hypothetical protein
LGLGMAPVLAAALNDHGTTDIIELPISTIVH